MKLKYTGPFEADIPVLGITVKPGDIFEAVGDDAKSLIRQHVAERIDEPNTDNKTKDGE